MLKASTEAREALTPGSLWFIGEDMMQDAAWTDPGRWHQHDLPYLVSAAYAVGSSGIVKKGTPAIYVGDTRVEEHDGTTRAGTVRYLRAVFLVGQKRYIVSNLDALVPAGAKPGSDVVG
jgi:hypothetical protein